jgi:hypothetical protein
VLPRLALDFTTGTLDPRVTVTRALNTATRINSAGLVEIVNANLPRFDYDPTTLVCRGLLIEELRANLALYSSDFADPMWLKNFSGVASAPVVTANYAVAPDGTTTADRVVFSLNGGTTTAAISTLEQAVTYTAASYAGSFWLKSNTGASQTILLVVANATVATLTVTPTWQRFSGARTTASGLSNFALRARGTFTGDITDISVWGAQVELGAFASSYIPTTTTSLTRNADSVTMTGTNFSDWYTSGSGTIIVSTLLSALSTTAAQTSINLGVDGNNQIYLYANNTAGSRDAVIVTSGSGQGFNSISGANTTSYTKQGFAFATNSSAHVINDGSPVTDATVTLPSAANTLTIGSNLSGFNLLNGYVAKIMYWPQRLTNAELQAFTK